MTAGLDAAALFRRLHEAGVEHVVIGGFAVIAHGVIRGTKDLDICPDPAPASLERLAGLLVDLDARQVGVGDFDQREMPFDPRSPGDLAEGGNFLVETRLGRLDVMQWVAGIDADSAYRVLVADAVEGLVHGTPVKVCSLQHLRLMKRTAGRGQDLQDLRDLAIAHPEVGG